MTTHRGEQRFLALPLKLLPGFLFGLTVSKVRPELQAKILRYQLDCYEVLWNAFKGDILPTPPAMGTGGAAVALEVARAVVRLAEQQLALEQRVGALAADTNRRLSALEVRLDPKQVLTEEQAAELALAVKNVGKALERQGDRQGYAKVYSELYRRYRISSYKNLPQSQFDAVLAWLAGWHQELESAP